MNLIESCFNQFQNPNGENQLLWVNVKHLKKEKLCVRAVAVCNATGLASPLINLTVDNVLNYFML